MPSGWRLVDRRLTPCTNPIERITIAGRGAMVMVAALDSLRIVPR